MSTKPNSKLLKIISIARQAGIGGINGTLLIEMEQSGAPELKKFAELIVRECIDIVGEYSEDGAYCQRQMIKERFGVE